MKLKNGEIFMARQPLSELAGMKFPVKTSYGLAKLAAKLNDQLTILDQVRKGLFETYGKPDPDSPQKLNINPTDEGYAKFTEEMNELMGKEVEIVLDVVTLPEMVEAKCGKCGEITSRPLELSPATLMMLEKFITVA